MAPSTGPSVAPPQEPRPDRRRYNRRLARANARVNVRRVAAGVGTGMIAKLMDVSENGACVQLSAPADIGEVLDLTMIQPNGRNTYRVLASVKWCRPVGGGLFAVGVSFQRQLTLTELARLVK